MEIKTKLLYMTGATLFFIGLSLYLFTTPDLEEVGFFISAGRSIGLLISTSIGVALVLKLILGRSLERDIVETVRSELEKISSDVSIAKYCIKKIIPKRTDMSSFENILSLIPENQTGVEVFVSGISLSAIFPFYNNLILNKINRNNFKFRFLFMNPKAEIVECFGAEIGESDTFENQLLTQLGHVRRLLNRLDNSSKNIEVRIYNTIPFNSIFYYKTDRGLDCIYLVIYLNSIPGAECPVIELSRNNSLDTTLFNKLLNCYEKLWKKSTPVEVKRN